MYFKYSEKEINYLCRKDKKLKAEIERLGFLERVINPDIFASLIQSIVGQQISNKAAITVNKRLFDLTEMKPKRLNALSIEEIQSCGMTSRKAGYIKGIAEIAQQKIIDFDSLNEKSDDEIIKILTSLNGVGLWTVEMLLIFSLNRMNIISYGDLVIRRGIMELYNHKELPKERFNRYAKRYSPYASVASLYLWEIGAANVQATSAPISKSL